MLIRVRSNVGIWRIDGLDENSATTSDIIEGIKKTRPHVVYDKPLCNDPACSDPLSDDKTLKEQGLRHGSMVHCRVDASTCADISLPTADDAAATTNSDQTKQQSETDSRGSNANMKRIIDKDGTIKLVHSSDVTSQGDDRGFRKGMLPLRDMKMQWTLNEFVALDDQYTFKIKRQEEAFAKKVSLDTPSVGDFQSYLRRFNFSRQRIGYLYGKFVPADNNDESDKDKKKDSSGSNTSTSMDTDNKDDSNKKQDQKVIVEAIYEPPQEPDPDSPEGFIVLEDPMEDTVEEIANMLGLRKVGWIVGHPPREKGFVMSSAEVIMAAELQLEAADGVEETPFVTVTVTVKDSEDGRSQEVSVEAFQVSKQCMEMAAEEVLEVGKQPGFCTVNETFTAIVEGKPNKSIDNNFFLTVVPIVQHTSDKFVSQFPKANRDHDDRTQSKDEMKRQLSKSGSAGWTFKDLLSDFNLLIYLSNFFEKSDMPKICECIRDDKELDEGYKILIASIAGMDGSY